MPKKLTSDEFLINCKLSYYDKYDYSKTIYTNYRTKILVICKIHGEFMINPYNHINLKQGCDKCARESHKLTEILPERLENFKKIHNNKYSYKDLSVNNNKINIICPSHGEFSQTIYHHEKGHGCYKCEKESRIKIRLRKCTVCNKEKEYSEFYPNYSRCIKCYENPIIPEYKTCNKCNTEKEIEEFNIRKNSKDGYRDICKECSINKVVRKIYKEKNKDILREKNKIYHKNRLITDPFYRSKIDARNIIRKALSERGYTKKSKTQEILGCSYIEFKNHIESQFQSGMSWENRNEWHIDHIVPLDFAKDENEILKLNHYTNLRPLFATENLSKSNSITIKTESYYEIIDNR